MGVLALYYIDYTRLSLDPLHCSMTALGCHIASERLPETKRRVDISVEPRLREDETARTVRLSFAVL
jgi:hypothetical protein